MSVEAQNETQAETIKALWHEASRRDREIEALSTRCEIQQKMLDWRQRRIDELEAQQSPQGQAEKVFK
jgi:hypothetical protein